MKKSFVKKKMLPKFLNLSTSWDIGYPWISDPHGKSQDSHHPNWVGVKKKNRSFESLVLCLGGIVALVI